MPAINTSRLKQQAAQIVEDFSDLETLQSKLTDLFTFYADRSQRPRQSGKPAPVIPAYKVPKAVIDRILFEMQEFIKADAAAALKIADHFWEHRYLEFRLLAAGILGNIPLDEPKEITKRLQRWGENCEEDILLELLAKISGELLQGSAKKEQTELLEFWLSSREQVNKELGLRALLFLLNKTDFRELPTVYRLLSPHVQEASSELRPHVLDTLRLLAQISPRETAYFLRKRIEEKRTPTNIWLTRRSLMIFPEELREGLKSLSE